MRVGQPAGAWFRNRIFFSYLCNFCSASAGAVKNIIDFACLHGFTVYKILSKQRTHNVFMDANKQQ